MLRDITIGQYYPSGSIIHKLDARVKFIGTMLFIISLFMFDTFWGFIPAAVFLICIIALSKIPARFIFKGLRPMLFLLIFMMLFNLFLTKGEVVFAWWIFSITLEGIKAAIFMGLRLTILLIGSSMMTYTSTPNQLTDAIEHVFNPLAYIMVPVHEIAMMMSIALRFIPILLEETDKIMKAQQARGADFENGGFFKRIKSMVPLLIPLFVSAFRRAGDLAQAMEARCYHGGRNRTKLNPLKYKARDFVAYLIVILYFVSSVIIP